MQLDPSDLTFLLYGYRSRKKHPEKVSGNMRTLELAGCFPGSRVALSILAQHDWCSPYVRAMMQHRQEEVAGEMASIPVWPRRGTRRSHVLHMNDPRALNGLAEQ